MKSLVRLTESDFLKAVIDTRFDLEITGISHESEVLGKVKKLYGNNEYAIQEGTLKICGTEELYKERYSVGDLVKIMGLLTSENGCPWDKVQTHESIRINAVEEAYELAEAINNKDLENMEEEIGDLLLQVIFHADIARRSGEFTEEDILTRLCSKLVNRHTHIFGANKADTPEEALKSWEEAKAKEKKEETLEDKLSRIPDSFSSALKTQKILKKLFKGGLENDADPAIISDLIKVFSGCLKNGVDVETDLMKETDKITEEFLNGKINRISEHK